VFISILAPILKIYEAGHKVPATFLPIGAKIEINTDKKELKIIENYLK
jgi:muramoyltetrapeptide carboxypeptidase LdcA involved in peptidoglycan recycling